MERGSIEGRKEGVGGGVNGSDKSENEKKRRTKGATRRERRLEERNSEGGGGRQLGFMGHWRGMQALVLGRNNNTLGGAIRELGRQGPPGWSGV